MVHDDHVARRSFLGASLAAAGAAAGGAVLTGCCAASPAATADRAVAPGVVKPGDVVLFQGDSITDAGRKREQADVANNKASLGNGYAGLAGAGLLVTHPADQLRVFNRGVSGNKVFQLAERWQRDCLDLEPDVLSILIGVNDIWHKLDGKYDGTVAIYERDYDALLARTRTALPKVALVVCEPFVLRCGSVDDSWFPEFDDYRTAARRVAGKHGATWVPFHEMFERAVACAPPEQWAKDGVHPSAAGAALMEQCWLDATR
jgi:lysophospholipase L1-like esterase